MSRPRFVVSLVIIFLLAVPLRALWLRADPPARASVGVVWHDEGAWVHNARNRALWGVWQTDAWNPVFVTPVFTALEYASFRLLGIGTWEARVVPVVSGLAAVAGVVWGLAVLGGRRAALVGGLLLATNYVFVTWNRLALMESTMTACLVGAWAAYALSERRAAWGLAAGAFAVLAWFTKASAAFFLAAIVLDALVTLVRSPGHAAESRTGRQAASLTLAGLAITTGIIIVWFVIPNWAEYRFYNWEMSVTRKPEYTVGAFIDRASWLPVAHDVFTRMWFVLVAGAIGLLAVAARWQSARPAERLLVLWIVIGLAELVVHDSGNARRYVMFIPALVASAALVLTSRAPLITPALATAGATVRMAGLPLVLLLAYLVVGSGLRMPFAADVNAGHLSAVVRLSAAIACACAALCWWQWQRVTSWLGSHRIPVAVAAAMAIIAPVSDLVQFGAWAGQRRYTNYAASVDVGQLLPSGTLVHGKLANGLSLENQIRPIFVGNGFGNYDDRLRRDDVQYLLTYDRPRIGFESSDGSGLIDEILAHYPLHRVVATFEVDETPGPDRAVLIRKVP